MKRVVFSIALAAIPALSAGVFAASYGATADIPRPEVKLLGDEADGLKKLAATSAPEEKVYQWAKHIFEQVPYAGTVNLQPYQIRYDFDKPEFSVHPNADQRTGDVNGMMHSFRDTLATKDVPAPVIARLAQDYAVVENLRRDNKVGYDKDGYLKKGTLGGYVYTPTNVIGIVLHEDLRTVAHYLGDALASLTLVPHEGGHGAKDAKGGLNKKHEVQDEIDAFNDQADALIVIDPKGDILRRNWALYVEEQTKERLSGSERELLKDIVIHLWRLRTARLTDSTSMRKLVREHIEKHGAGISYEEPSGAEEGVKGFVEKLGYHDHSHAASQSDGDEPGHPKA